jgi:hypothetical protein
MSKNPYTLEHYLKDLTVKMNEIKVPRKYITSNEPVELIENTIGYLDEEFEEHIKEYPNLKQIRSKNGKLRRDYSAEGRKFNMWNVGFSIQIIDRNIISLHSYNCGYSLWNDWHYKLTNPKQLELILDMYVEYRLKCKEFERVDKIRKIKVNKILPIKKAGTVGVIKNYIKDLHNIPGIKKVSLAGEITSNSYKSLQIITDDDIKASITLCNSKNPITVNKHLSKYNAETIPLFLEYEKAKKALEVKSKELKKHGISTSNWIKYG